MQKDKESETQHAQAGRWQLSRDKSTSVRVSVVEGRLQALGRGATTGHWYAPSSPQARPGRPPGEPLQRRGGRGGESCTGPSCTDTAHHYLCYYCHWLALLLVTCSLTLPASVSVELWIPPTKNTMWKLASVLGTSLGSQLACQLGQILLVTPAHPKTMPCIPSGWILGTGAPGTWHLGPGSWALVDLRSAVRRTTHGQRVLLLVVPTAHLMPLLLQN